MVTYRVELGFGRLQTARSCVRRLVGVPLHVEAEVRELARTPEGARSLASLLGAWPPISDRLAESTLNALACGELEYVEWSAGGFTGGSAAAVALSTFSADGPHEDLTEIPLHAVIVELLDSQDRPVAGAAYRVVDPAGRAHNGNLDHEGRAEIREIRAAGNCKVCFPEFDGAAWSYVHAQPL